MPASLVPPAKLTFVDINGKPLVGGFVYMYEPLSLIFKDTWQDEDQNVLNTNPIVLDSRGQAVIYGTGNYRQILKDIDGNTIWDEELGGFGASVFGPQDTLASNTTTDLGTAGSNNVLITGTTTINSFGTSATLQNPIYFIQFSGVLTLTYNATSMILPGAANITTAANDSAIVEFINALGYWRMVAYFSGSSGGPLGTAANENIGTSGATVPLLNGTNNWSGSQEFSTQAYSPEIALSVSAGATTPDFATGNNFSVSISANLILHNPINWQQGQSGIFRIKQTNAGLSITWGGAFSAPGGITGFNLSGINGAVDYFAYYVHDGTNEIVITPLLNVF